ncbi:MAG: hypothetical protein IPH45_00300 [Bacteroidales bacterium]|nr:hypothetical protein [Bacteroidales bacterium]MBK7174314.1 hypothetical protein [Bacteroidales bacterium]
METNWLIIVLVLVLIIALVVYAVIRNQKDKKELMKSLNKQDDLANQKEKDNDEDTA